MSIFSNESPLVQYAVNPQYAKGFAKTRLSMNGYKSNGEQNTLGKIESWVPGLNLITNMSAENIAKKNGAKDTAFNIGQDFDNRVDKIGAEIGVAGAVTGAVTGNSQMAIQGLNTAIKYAGSLAFDQNDWQQGDAIYM